MSVIDQLGCFRNVWKTDFIESGVVLVQTRHAAFLEYYQLATVIQEKLLPRLVLAIFYDAPFGLVLFLAVPGEVKS